MGLVNFRFLTSSRLVFNQLYLVTSHRQLPPKQVISSLPTSVGRRNIRFPRLRTYVQDLGIFIFLLPSPTNAVIYLSPTDPQLPKPKSLRSQLPAPFFLSYFFSFLPKKSAFSFLYILQHHVTLSLAICPLCSALLAGTVDGIQCQHSADECKSLLVDLRRLVYV